MLEAKTYAQVRPTMVQESEDKETVPDYLKKEVDKVEV